MFIKRIVSGLAIVLISTSAALAGWAHGSASSSFNGGRSQINFNGLGSNESPLLNIVKMGDAPFFNGGSFNLSPVRPDMLDSNGYPMTTNSGVSGTSSYAMQLPFPPTLVRGSSYTVKWTGGDSCTSISGPNGSSGTGANGNFTFTPTASAVSFFADIFVNTISCSPPTNYVTSLAVVYTPYLSQYNAGEILDPTFKSVMQQAKFGVIRFLNWYNSGGVTNMSLWASRKGGASTTPANFFTYADVEYRANYWVGSATTSNDLDYAVSGVPASPSHGATIQLQFAANSAYKSESGTCSGIYTTGSSSTAGINWTGHGFSGGEPIGTSYSSDPPSGIWSGQTVYVLNNGLLTANFFQVSATPGGSPIAIGSGCSGTQTISRLTTLNSGGSNIPIKDQSGNPTTYSAQTISSGTYNSSTGAVSLTLSANAEFANGTTIFVRGLTGTGTNLSSLDGNYNVTSVSGATVSLTAATGLGSITITGGVVTLPNTTGPLTVALGAGTQAIWATLVYDSTLNAWLKNGGDSTGSGGLINGVPFEVMLAVAKELGAHPWFPGVMMAMDPMTDFYPSLGAYVLANAPAWMVPRFETPNEDWNYVFAQTLYSDNKAFANWFAQFSSGATFDHDDEVGKMASTLGQAINTAYGTGFSGVCGSASNKYEIIVGYQTVTFASGNTPPSARLTASNYVNQSQSAQSGYTKSAASNWVSCGAIANYLNPDDQGTSTETTLNNTLLANGAQANGGAMGSTTITLDNSGQTIWGTIIPGQTVTDYYGQVPAGTIVQSVSGTSVVVNNSVTILDGSILTFLNSTAQSTILTYADTVTGSSNEPITLTTLKNTIYPNAGTFFAGFTNNSSKTLGTMGYEGCYSPDPAGSGQPVIRAMSVLSADVGKMYTGGTLASSTVVTGTYNDFVSSGGVFPSQFNLAGSSYPNNQPWPALQPDIFATPQTMQFLAIAAFN